MNKSFERHVGYAYTLLKIGFGAGLLIAGIDKFFGAIADWTRFISPFIIRYTHIPSTTILHVAGTIEIILGLLILSKYTRLGAFLGAGYFLFTAFNLGSTGIFFEVALRDILLACCALSLSILAHAYYKRT